MDIDSYIAHLHLQPWQRTISHNLVVLQPTMRMYDPKIDAPLHILGLLTPGQRADSQKLQHELGQISSSSHSFFGDLVAWYNGKGIVQVTFSLGTKSGNSVEDVFVPPYGVKSLDAVTEDLQSRYHNVEVRKYPLSLVSEKRGKIHNTENYL